MVSALVYLVAVSRQSFLMTSCTTCELTLLQVQVAVDHIPAAPVILWIVDGLEDVSQTEFVRTIWLQVVAIRIVSEDAFQHPVAEGIVPVPQVSTACDHGVSVPIRLGLAAVDHG